MKKIDIKGVIVPDDHIEVYQWFGYAATSPSLVKAAIAEAEAAGETEILVEINSGGGSVWAGAEIYYALKKFDGTVKGEIPSIAASAATFIAMACDVLSMSILAQFMIHGASTWQHGNHQDMNNASDFLKNIDDSIINSYLTKTSLSREELRELMNKDSWMTAQQAKDYGFVDEILFGNFTQDAVASANVSNDSQMLSQDVIDKIKSEILAQQQNTPSPVNSTNITQTNSLNKEESKIMDLKQLKNDHPELVEAIQKEAVENERNRIQEIENIATPGMEEIINKAKFESGASAAETAMEIIKAQKEQNTVNLQNRIVDAEPLNTIVAEVAPANKTTNQQELEDILNNLYGGN